MMKKGFLIILTLLLLIATANALGEVVFSEVMAQNGVWQNGHAYDWVELYNSGSRQEDLSGWFLSDSRFDLTRWSFPQGTKLKKGEYLTVYCTGDSTLAKGKNKTFYADFKISAKGGTLYLSDAEGNLVQSLKLPRQYGNVSYGLSADGAAYGFLENATPGKKNNAPVFSARLSEPVLTPAGGMFEGSVTVTATGETGAVLRYTLDGETPTEKSPVFPESGLEISKTTPLRVKAFSDSLVSSPCAGGTYLIGEDLHTPVVCLISDDKYLFNAKTGALVKGNGSVPNYEKELEYPVHIEYFNEYGVCEISQTGSFTAAGHSARQNTQRSIALYARKAYGPEDFDFNPFPHRDYQSYHSLLLRSTNSDAFFCRLRDVVGTALAEGEELCYQDALCIQVYINGRYWGHYNLREKINKYMVAQWEGITDEDEIDSIDVISRTGTERFTSNGSGEDWVALADFCKKNDLNDPENLAYVTDRLDVDSLFTHAAYQIILGNKDFTNVRLYRVPGGKWKYLLFDVEACFNSVQKTPLEYYIKPVKGKIQGFRHEPLNALLNVPEMKAAFLTRVAEIMEKHFSWPDVRAVFDQWESDIGAILPRHIERWKNLTMEKWDKNIRSARYYARVRPLKVPALLQTAMKLTDAEVETYFGETLRLLNETNAAD